MGRAAVGHGYVLVLSEPARVARAHPPLREDADRHRGVDGGVDADGEVARVLEDDRRAEVLEAGLGPDVPRRDERQGKEDADGEADRHHVVDTVNAEHLGPEAAPGDTVRVERLRVLAGPETRAGDGEEGVAVRVDDGEHHDVWTGEVSTSKR